MAPLLYSGIWSDKLRVENILKETRRKKYLLEGENGINTCPFCVTESNISYSTVIVNNSGRRAKFKMANFDALKTVFHTEKKFKELSGEKIYQNNWIDLCMNCGWWIAHQSLEKENYGEGYMYESSAVSELLPLSKRDYSEPINEVRNFLINDFGRNSSLLHPELYEDVVASVFRDFGYGTILTQRSGDDGIDIFLNRGDVRTGVQVKRYKNKIKVDSIRSLAGAMIINDLVKGVFVTTDGFQSGCYTTADAFTKRGLQIDLIDGDYILRALQIEKLDASRDWYEINNAALSELALHNSNQIY